MKASASASSGDEDPARDISELVNQLHRGVREAREQALAADREKEATAGQLQRALAELHTAREREEELKLRLVEINALKRERDSAVAAAEQHARSIGELQKRMSAVAKERDSFAQRREESARQAEAVNKSAQTTAAQLAQTQKQVLAIRQARDAAQAQLRTLEDKISAADDQISDLTYSRDQAMAAARDAAGERDDLRRRLEAYARHRDTLTQQVQELTNALEQERARAVAQNETHTAGVDADSAALAFAQQQLTALASERDAAAREAAAQASEAEELRARLEKMAAEKAAAETALAETAAIRHQLDSIARERDSLVDRELQFRAETESQQEQLAALSDQFFELQQRHEETLNSLATAQEEMAEILRANEDLRAHGSDAALELEAQLEALRMRNLQLEAETDELSRLVEESRGSERAVAEMSDRLERQRLESIDVAARLDSARREIIELSASLAESRLQVKQAAALLKKAPAVVSPVSTLPPKPEPRRDFDEEPASEFEPVGINETLSDRDAKRALTAMRHCLNAFTRQPTDLSHLNELHSHAHGFAERARVSGLVAVHRLTAAFSQLALDLYQIPEQINASTLRTINVTLDFLSHICKERLASRLSDPAKAVIHLVEDDQENCRAVCLAMERSMLRTTCSMEPSTALERLAEGGFDLIFLDVNLPEMNGFELCARIRDLPACAATPVIFITGAATIENRVQSSLSGGNDFVAKPFNLHELSVKALTLLLQSQLQMVGRA